MSKSKKANLRDEIVHGTFITEGAMVAFPQLEAYKDRLGELLLLGLSQIKIQEAILLYQRGVISLGRAAELAGLQEQEMARQARALGVSPRWAEKMLEEETLNPRLTADS